MLMLMLPLGCGGEVPAQGETGTLPSKLKTIKCSKQKKASFPGGLLQDFMVNDSPARTSGDTEGRIQRITKFSRR